MCCQAFAAMGALLSVGPVNRIATVGAYSGVSDLSVASREATFESVYVCGYQWSTTSNSENELSLIHIMLLLKICCFMLSLHVYHIFIDLFGY